MCVARALHGCGLMTASVGPPNRAANATITGFAYQFDLTTLTILSADPSATIVVEGCEDVDVLRNGSGTAVQCKYLEASSYSLPRIRKAIIPMVRAFAGGQEWDYRLYVHFRDSAGIPTTLTLDELKSCLTENKRDGPQVRHYAGITDSVLTGFLRRFTIHAGDTFSDQQQEVQAALASALGASTEDVCDLHYPSSVALVMELAMRPTIAHRQITRASFLEFLNKRPAMYTRWYQEHLGLDRFKTLIKRRIKAVDLLASNKRRLIMLESPPPAGDNLAKVSHVVEMLATKMYGPGKLSSAKPWTVIILAHENEVLGIKRCLISNGIAINDGFEHVEFSAALFDRDAIINTRGSSKIIEKTSYDVRILSARTYEAHRAQLRPPAVAISFANTSTSAFVDDENAQRLDIPGWKPDNILDLLGVTT